MTKITPDLLIKAYKIGVFPMANNQDDPKIDFERDRALQPSLYLQKIRDKIINKIL